MTNPQENSLENSQELNSNSNDSFFKMILDRLTKIELSLASVVNMQENISNLQKNVEGVVASQTVINTEFEGNKKMVENMIKKNTILGQQVEKLNKEHNEKTKPIDKLLTHINEQEQYGRINMVDV